MKLLTVDDVIRNIRDLPSMPIVVTDLLSSFEQQDVNIGILAEKVSYDQALSAKTLRLANSSFYGLSRKVTTIQQAITILGFDSVRALVCATSIVENFRTSSDSGFNHQAFWCHAVATALCSKHIARAMGVNQDHAFICGLLHDIGKLVLITRFPLQYQEVLRYRDANDCHILKAEKEVIDINHPLVGCFLAENWKFPILMQKAINNHHQPDLSDPSSMQSIVHVANAIVHALDIIGDPHELVPDISDSAWKSLNIKDKDLWRVYRDTEAEFEEACQILVAC